MQKEIAQEDKNVSFSLFKKGKEIFYYILIFR